MLGFFFSLFLANVSHFMKLKAAKRKTRSSSKTPRKRIKRGREREGTRQRQKGK